MFSKRKTAQRGSLAFANKAINHPNSMANLPSLLFASSSQMDTFSARSSSLPLTSSHKRSNSTAASSTATSDFKPQNARFDLNAVGGINEVIGSLTDILNYLRDPASFTRLGAAVPSGILLSGAPGTGKTMLAEAIAGHAGIPIFMISGSEMTSMWMGETERKLREIFNEARKAAPCVLCIDEIDSIGQKRGSGSETGYQHHYTTITNQLLTLMTQDNKGVVIIATTNNINALDPALTRPGRFDRHIVVPLPDALDREKILVVLTKNKTIAPEVSLATLAKLSAGFSGAKLRAWINEAIICATRSGADKVSMDHFDQARALIQEGAMSRYSSNDDENRKIAIHEAAHAFIGHLLGKKLYKTSIAHTENKYGYTEFVSEDDKYLHSREELRREICIKLAGRAAEMEFNSELLNSTDDLTQVKEMVANMVKNEGMGSTIINIDHATDMEIILQEEMKKARRLIKENRDKFEKMTQALAKYGQLKEEDFIKALDNQPIDPQPYHRQDSRSITIALPPSCFANYSLKQQDKMEQQQEAKESTKGTVDLFVDSKLEAAIKKGDKNKVRDLLDGYGNKNSSDYDNLCMTAVYIAANEGQGEIVELLFSRGIKLTNSAALGAAELAELNGHDDVIDIIRKQYPDVPMPSRYSSYQG
jgi:cell division protease FtsH